MSMICKTPPTDPVVTPELVRRHGLTGDEFKRIKKILGREPNFTELGIFSVMWSEHCSYKNSQLRSELVRRHGLTGDEFKRIKKILGREPNFTELGIFSVMWSEHCSYKNSQL